jgi:hypothetical protein
MSFVVEFPELIEEYESSDQPSKEGPISSEIKRSMKKVESADQGAGKAHARV